MEDRSIKSSRLVERLERRMSRRPQLGLTPTFYARFGLADPWLGGSADADPGTLDDGFTLVSARPFYAMMRRLAQARWRRERRVSRFFERRAGVLTATRSRRFPGETAAPLAGFMPASSGFMPPGPAQSTAWRGMPDLGGMALPQAWTPPQAAAPVAQEQSPRRRSRGSTARVSPVAWLSHKTDPARVVRTPSSARAGEGRLVNAGRPAEVRERIIEVEREESESFAARPSRDVAGSAPRLRGRSPATREHLTVEPENTGRAPARPPVEREALVASTPRRAAAAAAAEQEDLPPLRPAAPAQWAGLRLAYAAQAADPLARAVDERAPRLPAAARRVIDEVILSTEGLDAETRITEIRRVIRRRLGARVVREVLEDVVPEAVERPASFAAARSLPEAGKSRGLRPVLSASPTMQTVAPLPEAAAPEARPAARRARRPASAAWASSRAIGAASTSRATAPVGRRVDAARAAATPATLSRSPVSRAPLNRGAQLAPIRGAAPGAAVLPRYARTVGGTPVRGEAPRAGDTPSAQSATFRTPASSTQRSAAFHTPSSERAEAPRPERSAASPTAQSEGFRTPSAETARSEAFRTPSSETARSEGFRTPSGETARSEAFRTPSSATAQSPIARVGRPFEPADVDVEAEIFDAEEMESAAFEAPRRAASAWAVDRIRRVAAESPEELDEAMGAPIDAALPRRAGGTSWAAERLSSSGTPSDRLGTSTSILPRVAPSVADSSVVLTVSSPEEAEALASEVKRRNPKASVKVISGASAWRSPGEPKSQRERALPKGLSVAALRDIAPSVGYTAASVLREPATRGEQGVAALRTSGPVPYARMFAPSATVLSPIFEASGAEVSPGFRTPSGARRATPTFRTPRGETGASAAFRTPRGAWVGSQTFRTPEGRYVPASSHRTPGSDVSVSRAWRTPRGAWTGASVFRTPSGEQLARGLPAVYQPRVEADGVLAAPIFGGEERPLDWAGSRGAPSGGTGYRGAFATASAPSASMLTAAPTMLTAAPGGGESASSSASSAPPRRAVRGRRDLYTTLGAVHQGAAGPGAPGWAERGTEEPRVRVAGDILRTLARAGDEEEVVRIIIDRGQELKGAMNVPSPVTRVIEEIRSKASAAASAAPQQAMLGGAGTPARAARGGKAGSTRSSARVISGWTGLAARSTATSTPGVGDDRIMKLVRKLKGLIHLAETQKSDAQRQVRLAASDGPGVRPEGSADLSSNEKTEQQDVDVEALAREVLEVVSRELELRQERRQEDPDVSVWW